MSPHKRPVHFFVLVVVLLASAIRANPAIYPASLDAGFKVLGEPGMNQVELSIRNSGSLIHQFTGDGVTIGGPDAAEFEIVEMPSLQPMNVGEVRHVPIRFNPQSLGVKQANIIITMDSLENPEVTVSLTGTAVVERGTTVSGVYNGYGPGISTIGPGGDHESLFEAAAAISRHSLTGGDWTFLITDDLVEPHNSIIGQRNTNGHTITFRPAPGSNPTVTFTTTTQNLNGRPGHFLIGGEVSNDQGFWRLRTHPTHNITIDGSTVAGGTGQSMTFQNISDAGLNAHPGATSLLQVSGNCDHIQVRNCRFLYAAPNYASLPPAVVDFAAVNNFPGYPGAPPDEVPDYGVISNCVISTTGTGAVLYTGIGINDRLGGSPPYHIDPGSWGFQITSNTISNLYYCMSIRFCADAVISNNTLDIDIYEPPYRNTNARRGIFYGITMPEGGATTPTINGNHIRFIGDGPSLKSMEGIVVDSRSTTNTILVTNNMISGLTAPPEDVNAFSLVYGIRNSSDELCTVTVAHNSISFVEDADAQSTTSRCAAIGNSTINQYFIGNTVIRNNIIRMVTRGGCAIMRLPAPQNAPQGSIISEDNIIYTVPEAYVAHILETGYVPAWYETLEDWTAASGQDSQSRVIDPFVPAELGLGTGTGVSTSRNPDMHFTSYPGDAYRVPALDFVTTDFDGDPRSGVMVIAGADEVSEVPSSVMDWSMY